MNNGRTACSVRLPKVEGAVAKAVHLGEHPGIKSLGYDPEKDFEPISLFAVLPNVIVVNSKLPPKTLKEFIAYAKARPKQLNYGTVGVGSSQHIAGAYFDQVAGVELIHVPYRNIAQYTPDFIAGAVPVGFQLLPNVLALLQKGDARPLAVTAEKRMTALPDVPTTAEAGVPDYVTGAWFAMLAPRRWDRGVLDLEWRFHQFVVGADV